MVALLTPLGYGYGDPLGLKLWAGDSLSARRIRIEREITLHQKTRIVGHGGLPVDGVLHLGVWPRIEDDERADNAGVLDAEIVVLAVDDVNAFGVRGAVGVICRTQERLIDLVIVDGADADGSAVGDVVVEDMGVGHGGGGMLELTPLLYSVPEIRPAA